MFIVSIAAFESTKGSCTKTQIYLIGWQAMLSRYAGNVVRVSRKMKRAANVLLLRFFHFVYRAWSYNVLTWVQYTSNVFIVEWLMMKVTSCWPCYGCVGGFSCPCSLLPMLFKCYLCNILIYGWFELSAVFSRLFCRTKIAKRPNIQRAVFIILGTNKLPKLNQKLLAFN